MKRRNNLKVYFCIALLFFAFSLIGQNRLIVNRVPIESNEKFILEGLVYSDKFIYSMNSSQTDTFYIPDYKVVNVGLVYRNKNKFILIPLELRLSRLKTLKLIIDDIYRNEYCKKCYMFSIPYSNDLSLNIVASSSTSYHVKSNSKHIEKFNNIFLSDNPIYMIDSTWSNYENDEIFNKLLIQINSPLEYLD